MLPLTLTADDFWAYNGPDIVREIVRKEKEVLEKMRNGCREFRAIQSSNASRIQQRVVSAAVAARPAAVCCHALCACSCTLLPQPPGPLHSARAAARPPSSSLLNAASRLAPCLTRCSFAQCAHYLKINPCNAVQAAAALNVIGSKGFLAYHSATGATPYDHPAFITAVTAFHTLEVQTDGATGFPVWDMIPVTTSQLAFVELKVRA